MKNLAKVHYYDWNTVGRDFLVSDLHGCLDALFKLMTHINFDPSVDRMFSVGDMIDRGKNSKECLELIYMPWFHAVRANHEDMLIHALVNDNNNAFVSWLYNGGQWYHSCDVEEIKTIASYANDTLPYIIVLGKDTPNRVNIVHAELYKAKDEEFVDDIDIDTWNFMDYQEDNILWGRHICENRVLFDNNSKYSNYGLSTTYAGHTPISKPFEIFNHRFIDTGACYWDKSGLAWASLTICNLQSDDVYIYNLKDDIVTETDWHKINNSLT